MPEAEDKYPFERFPHRKLNLGVNRRQLLSALLTEFLVYSGKADGGLALSLADLGEMPDEQLAEIIPEIIPGSDISVRDGYVWGRPPSAHGLIQLFPLGLPAVTAFNLFNGRTPLGDASTRLARALGWDQAHSFAYARGLFLCLVMVGLCRPAG